MARLRIAVLTGGRAGGDEIAVASARSVIDSLDPGRYETVTVEIGRDGRWQLPRADRGELGRNGDVHGSQLVPVSADRVPEALGGVDVVFPVLHGPFGEDGTVQGLLELADVPYVGAGVTASSLCMDKDLMKAVLRDRGIPVTRNVVVRASERGRVENPFGFPVFVKPARLGSSVGITKARSPEDLRAGLELALRHDEKVLIEEFVTGVEVECGVLGNEQPIASLPGEIITGSDWYDYSAKYDEGGMELIVPPRLPEDQVRRVQDVSVQAFVATECEGMARVDCFVRADGGGVV